MSQVEQIHELERLLTRQRMILEQLHVHLEGLAPHTWAAIQANSRVKDAVQAIRSLEAMKHALHSQAGMFVLH